ncbi:TPA: hypothetical protein OOF55_003604 [Morganella morganii]|nr:hypothetical protein [Morganella morganii]HCR3994308.1 hypothetical protein [Morganella morganii]
MQDVHRKNVSFIQSRLHTRQNARQSEPGMCAITIEEVMSRKCMFCGGEADLLCDGVICYIGKRSDDGALSGFSAAYTCDAPMCASCSTFHGNLHWRRGNTGGFDSLDYCPVCVRQEIGFGRKFIFDEIGQVKIHRQAHYAKFKSRKGNHLLSLTGGGQICLDI